MDKNMIRLALRGFLNGKPVPRTAEGKERLAAQFVEYLGSMNQSDREFQPWEKYATDTWEDHEQTQPGHPWKDDKRNEMGFGISRTAARKKKALEATKLSFLILGSEQSDDLLEEQARDFMAMPLPSIKATSDRVRELLANDESGQDENPEHDGNVEGNEDSEDELEETTDVGPHDDEDEVENLEEASSEEEAEEEVEEDADESKTAKVKDPNTNENKEKEREASLEDELEEILEAIEKGEECDEDDKVACDESAGEESEDSEEESDDDEVEVEDEEDEVEVSMDSHTLDDTSDSDITGEDEELDMLYAEEDEEDEDEELEKSAKTRTAGVKKLGGVAQPSSEDEESTSLSKLWKGAPRVDWDRVDSGLFDE